VGDGPEWSVIHCPIEIENNWKMQGFIEYLLVKYQKDHFFGIGGNNAPLV
jgi:hypothetical protein